MSAYEKWADYEPEVNPNMKQAYAKWRRLHGIKIQQDGGTRQKSTDSSDFRHAKYKGRVEGVKIK